MPHDFAVDVLSADPPGDQLGILRAEIQHQHLLAGHSHHCPPSEGKPRIINRGGRLDQRRGGPQNKGWWVGLKISPQLCPFPAGVFCRYEGPWYLARAMALGVLGKSVRCPNLHGAPRCIWPPRYQRVGIVGSLRWLIGSGRALQPNTGGDCRHWVGAEPAAKIAQTDPR